MWGGLAAGGVAATASPGRLHINLVCAVPAGSERETEAGVEYDAFRIVIDYSHTVGEGSCTGCLNPACIIFKSLLLTQPEGVGDVTITTGLQTQLSWRGAIYNDCGTCTTSPCPIERRTWGSLKSLFR